MEIRALTDADAVLFQALRLGALRESPTAFSSSHGEECDIPLATVAARIAPSADRCLFGAFDLSGLVGCIGLQREKAHKLAHKACIWGMYVDPLHRNRGIGRDLIARAIAHAASMPGLLSITLGVTKGNSAAFRLYEKMGFRVFGIEPSAMLIDGELLDEIHMIRSIKCDTQEP